MRRRTESKFKSYQLIILHLHNKINKIERNNDLKFSYKVIKKYIMKIYNEQISKKLLNKYFPKMYCQKEYKVIYYKSKKMIHTRKEES